MDRRKRRWVLWGLPPAESALFVCAIVAMVAIAVTAFLLGS
jgi:hypothetical protein